MKTNTKLLMSTGPTFTCQPWSTCCQRLRHHLCVVRLLPLLLWAVPVAVQAQYSYTTTPNGAVTIPSTINGLLVTSIGDSAFEGTGLTSVETPNSETTIAPAKTSIPWQQLGAKASADYQGGGLAAIPTAEGARLRCVFQRLEGEATSEGLWLTSTLTNAVNDRFRVTATEVGRFTPNAPKSVAGAENKTSSIQLEKAGTVEVADKLVRFVRPGVTEAYSVSRDGLRQDFIIEQRPAGTGELAVRLAVSGAWVAPVADGAQLELENSGRKIAYSRLRVTDATGKELTARMEVVSVGDEVTSLKSEQGSRVGRDTPCAPSRISESLSMAPDIGAHGVTRPTVPMLAVLVNDADAVYPVRIDPTFSDANWISMNPSIPGANVDVSAAVVDGSGNLYIGGAFTVVGDVVANYIAKWNGSSWTALGSGMNGQVNALAVSGSNLYAGGFFTTAGGSAANYIAKWNGRSWTALGLGMSGGQFGTFVSALAVSGSEVYAGGDFTTAGDSAATNVAKWNGSSWSALASGMNNIVYALAVSGSDVYAGGRFTTAGGNVEAKYIAKWDGTSWSALGSGITDSSGVNALAVLGSDVYAGGGFATAGGRAATNIAKWNGSSWSALASGMNGRVDALAVSGSDLYAGGTFTTSDGSTANYIAKWDGSSWSALGSGMNEPVGALTVSGTNVYAGGGFTAAGGSVANYIAKWNGSSWSALGSVSGINAFVSALAVSGSDLHAGGYFTTAGGSAANHIAKWNGSSWTGLGSGMNDIVRALAVSGSDVYAGGSFTTAGGSAATNIAKWNGNSWSALGSGLNSDVYALAVSGGDVYAGGFFTTAGGSLAANIAKWDGSGWSALGSGVDGLVQSLGLSGSDVYAGGSFTTAGGSAAANIVKWNGSSWTALGSGLDGGDPIYFKRVFALAVSGSDVYAGGGFQTAGGNDAYFIAKWNGSNWTALGSGMDERVFALAVSGSDVYAGGWFTTAGGSAANHIAKWDGSSWTTLGSGMGSGFRPSVSALAVSGSDLYAGGGFTTAGGKVSPYIARAYLGTLPTLSVLRSGTEVMVSWPSADTAGFALEQAGTLSAPLSWVTNSASVTDDGAKKSVTPPATNSAQFFHLRRP